MATVKGGNKLGSALAKIEQRLRSAEKLRVGFLEGATYPDGTPVALIAAIHDFGAPAAGIPPRPFFRGMVKDKKSEWPSVIHAALKTSGGDVATAFGIVGEHVKAELQEAIRNFSGVPLKPKTIARKGFDKQLINTGHMLNSVGYEVK